MVTGLHIPRQEGRAHSRSERSPQDCQLRGLEPSLPPGQRESHSWDDVDTFVFQILVSASDDNTVRVWGPTPLATTV